MPCGKTSLSANTLLLSNCPSPSVSSSRRILCGGFLASSGPRKFTPAESHTYSRPAIVKRRQHGPLDQRRRGHLLHDKARRNRDRRQAAQGAVGRLVGAGASYCQGNERQNQHRRNQRNITTTGTVDSHENPPESSASEIATDYSRPNTPNHVTPKRVRETKAPQRRFADGYFRGESNPGASVGTMFLSRRPVVMARRMAQAVAWSNVFAKLGDAGLPRGQQAAALHHQGVAMRGRHPGVGRDDAEQVERIGRRS